MSCAPELAGYLHFWSERSIELALCTTSNISCSPPGQPILAFTVDLIASSGLGSAGIYTTCVKNNTFMNGSNIISCALPLPFMIYSRPMTFIITINTKIPKLGWSNMPPPHPFLHHECLTQNRIRHMKKPCRMLLRPFVGDTGEGVLHVQPGIKVGYQPTLRKKTNTCIVVLFWENSKTRYIEHLVLKWEWIEIHILSMLLSMLGVWCSRNGWHFRSYKLPRERLIDGQEAFIGDFQDLNQS